MKTASGYDVAWKNTSSGHYTVWSTDNTGNFKGNLTGDLSGTSSALQLLEPVFQQDLNSDHTIGATRKVIEKNGSSSLVEVAKDYFLYGSSGSGPALKYKGANVTEGQFGGWTPIGAVKTASGYDVAWKNTSIGHYTVWSTDNTGNFKGNLTGDLSGTSSALQLLEPVFQQDLNSDHTIGATRKVIEKNGSSSLVEVAKDYFLYGSSGSGPALKYKGANVTEGQFGGWTPIGAVKTASGYDVAWKNTSSGHYTVWSTDNTGNFKGNLTGDLSGTSSALQLLEPVFQQDLNSDHTIGATRKVIEKNGSSSLVEVAKDYFLYGSSGSGPALKYKGANVTEGQFGGWTPIGAVKTASGYDVAWKNTSSGHYTVWSTDNTGNFKGNLTGDLSGTSSALQLMEPVFQQDLNSDHAIGLYAKPGSHLTINQALGSNAGLATIGAGATLELTAADTASVTFAGSTGTLRIDHASTFAGKIFNFGGDGSLSGSDHIDLRDLKYGSIKDSYANGVLTLTDNSGKTAKLNFNGSYSLGNFKFANDGAGGTIIYDPPVLPSPVQHPVNPATTLADLSGSTAIDQITRDDLPNGNRGEPTTSAIDGLHGANVALLGNYMASSFAVPSGYHGATMVATETSQPNEQSLVTNPHHA